MKKSAKTMSQHKFQKLSVQRQHGLLMALAEEAKEDGDIEGFLHRYDELHSWSRLDRYEPPAWLSVAEALDEYRIFHAGFKAKTNKEDPPTLPLPQSTSFTSVSLTFKPICSGFTSALKINDTLSMKTC